MWLVTIAFSTILLSSFIILFRKAFFKLAEDTLSLLNTLLDSEADDKIKQKKLIIKLSQELKSLGIFILAGIISVVIVFMPIFLYMNITQQNFKQLDFSSFEFFLVLIISSIIPFIIFSLLKNKKSDYTEWSVLLHRLILDNYNISKSLFSIESSFYRKKLRKPNQKYLIISGLARSGTTALTTQLFQTGKFHSLNYSNMPFLLCPNLWKKIYNPQKSNLKERKHGDKLMFGYDTVAAMEIDDGEEYFFKVYLNDQYVKDNSLVEHEVDDITYAKYLDYQNLIKTKGKEDSVYLSKNNNLILRYRSLRNLNDSFLAVFLFRDPLNHAYSLLKQHVRFSDFQQEDPFITDYMNWLGHHEFGEKHKYFQFSFSEINDNYDRNSINYWLTIWINYYTRILEIHDGSFLLIDYNDYLEHPKELINLIGQHLNKKFNLGFIEPFKNKNKYEGKYDSILKNRAEEIYQELINKKFDFYNNISVIQ